jgi:hypothetical protein
MSLQAYVFNLDDKPKEIFLGSHGGVAVWNDGANSVFITSGTNAPPVEWVKSGGVAFYDNTEDKKLFLSCFTGLTTSIRLQTYGEPIGTQITSVLNEMNKTLRQILMQIVRVSK